MRWAAVCAFKLILSMPVQQADGAVEVTCAGRRGESVRNVFVD